MSLLKVEIRPIVGSPLEINTVDGSGNNRFPLKQFDIVSNVDDPGDARKVGAHGQWPKFHYVDALTVDAVGDILGVGGDNDARAADYITQRLALLDALLPPIDVSPMTSRYHATLRVRMDGMDEDADALVVCKSKTIPIVANYPAYSEFQILWKSFEPYFVGVTSGDKYILG